MEIPKIINGILEPQIKHHNSHFARIILCRFPNIVKSDMWHTEQAIDGSLKYAYGELELPTSRLEKQVTRSKNSTYTVRSIFSHENGDIFTTTSVFDSEQNFMRGIIRNKSGKIIAYAYKNPNGQLVHHRLTYVAKSGTEQRVMPLFYRVKKQFKKSFKALYSNETATKLLSKLRRLKH